MKFSGTNLPAGIERAMRRAPALKQPTERKGDLSASIIRATKALAGPASAEPVASNPSRLSAGLSKPRKKQAMNKTEAAFSLRLMAQKQAGEIIRWDREGITLRWPDGMAYTADFAVMKPMGGLEYCPALILVEVKGAFIEGDALVKFRAARAYWPEFQFEMHQFKKGQWERIL